MTMQELSSQLGKCDEYPSVVKALTRMLQSDGHDLGELAGALLEWDEVSYGYSQTRAIQGLRARLQECLCKYGESHSKSSSWRLGAERELLSALNAFMPIRWKMYKAAIPKRPWYVKIMNYFGYVGTQEN